MPKIEVKGQGVTDVKFKQRIRNKFKQEAKRIISKYNLETLVLVLDQASAKILSKLFTMFELVQEKITFLERLEVNRKALDLHALYFVAATKENVNKMIEDFTKKDEPQYKKVHILFTTPLDIKLLKEIAQCSPLVKRISKHSLKQFNFELRFLQDNAVSMDIPYLSDAYGSQSKEQQFKRGVIAKKFIEIIAGFDSINVVRIYYQKSPNMVAERLAKKVLQEVQSFYDLMMESKCQSISRDATDLTFFIVDRSFDVITPVLHSFTYESLLFDLLKISFEGTEEAKNKEYRKFEEIQDEIYDQIRFKHISVSMEWLHQQLTEKNEQLKSLGNQVGVDLKKITNQIKLLQKHITISLEMIQKFNQKKLNEVAELEQCIATGILENGKATSSVEVLKAAMDIITNNVVLSGEEKLRIAILCLCGIKTSKADYLSLLNLFNEEDQRVLKNLVVLGVNYDSQITKSTKAFDNTYRAQAKQRLARTNMPLDRYSNTLETILPKIVKDITQDNAQWQKFRNMIGRQFVSALKEVEPEQRFDSSKFVSFVCGGLSFAQLCSLKNQASMSKIVLASNSILSPSMFISELRKINRLESRQVIK